MLVCFCFVFLILFNACKYFKRPLGNQLPKCVEGLPFLNKSHNNNNNNNFPQENEENKIIGIHKNLKIRLEEWKVQCPCQMQIRETKTKIQKL